MDIKKMTFRSAGFSLVEVMVSLGVLAVAIPLVMASLAAGANADAAARIDSLAPAMTRVCLDELAAMQRGHGRWIADASGPFPKKDEVWAIGFSAACEPLGRVEAEEYRAGSRDKETLCFARIEDITPAETVAQPSKIRLTVEFPAVARQEKRQRLEFFTCLPR